MKKCPYCAEEVQDDAIKCKHCNEMFEKGDGTPGMGRRRCLKCGYTGPMKTWLRNYNFPQLLIVVGLFFMAIPSFILMAWGWGKYKCPECGALAKNVKA